MAFIFIPTFITGVASAWNRPECNNFGADRKFVGIPKITLLKSGGSDVAKDEAFGVITIDNVKRLETTIPLSAVLVIQNAQARQKKICITKDLWVVEVEE